MLILSMKNKSDRAQAFITIGQGRLRYCGKKNQDVLTTKKNQINSGYNNFERAQWMTLSIPFMQSR